MRTEMRTKISLSIILAAVVAIGLTAVSANGQTSETRRAARRDRRIQAPASLDVPVEQQLPCYGEAIGEGRGLRAGRGNWNGRPGAGRGGVQGYSGGGQGRGAGRGNLSGRLGAGRGRGQGFSDCGGVSQGRGAGRGNWMVGPGAGRGRGQGISDCGGVSIGRRAGRGSWGGRPGAQRGRGYGRNFAP